MSVQTFLCILCREDFASIGAFNTHEKGKVHRSTFEKRMDDIRIGMLLCKCCYLDIPNRRAWEAHIRSVDHIKLVAQSEFMGKKCVWDVPGVKMEDGSIKLCKDMESLKSTGWQDPEVFRKMGKKLESDLVIGMNCISLLKFEKEAPVYSCTLCDLDFLHTNREHCIGQKHRINVIWNWDKEAADRVARGLDFPKPSTRAKAQQELHDITQKIFEAEQERLNDEQYDLYLVIVGRKHPDTIRPRTGQPGETAKVPPKPFSSVSAAHATSSTSAGPLTDPYSQTPHVAGSVPLRQTAPAPQAPDPYQTPVSTAALEHKVKRVRANAEAFPEQPANLNGTVTSVSAGLRQITPEFTPDQAFVAKIKKLRENPPGSAKAAPAPAPAPQQITQRVYEMLQTLAVLGESLLHYQTNRREVPMELGREQIQGIMSSTAAIEERIRLQRQAGG